MFQVKAHLVKLDKILSAHNMLLFPGAEHQTPLTVFTVGLICWKGGRAGILDEEQFLTIYMHSGQMVSVPHDHC